MEEGLSIILPAYKEAENLSLLLPKLHQVLSFLTVPYEILVIDTITPLDNTKDICAINNARYLIRENSNLYGDAIRTGIKNVQYSKTLIMDADCSHNPQDIKKMYLKMQEGYDICIGSRYTKGGNTANNLLQRLMSYAVNLTFAILFNIKIKDISNSLKIYHSEQLQSLRLNCNYFDIVEEILIKLKRKYKSLKITEVPIYFDKRLNGESKRTMFSIICAYLTTIIKLQVKK